MTNKIEISRELLNDLLDSARLEVDERVRSFGDGYRPHVLAALRKMVADAEAILAAPAVERQVEPAAWVLTRDEEVCYEADDGIVISNTPGDENNLYKWKPVYFEASPPAPVAVVLPTMDDFLSSVESIWGFGPNQICLLDGNDLKLIWNACLDKVKELNQ